METDSTPTDNPEPKDTEHQSQVDPAAAEAPELHEIEDEDLELEEQQFLRSRKRGDGALRISVLHSYVPRRNIARAEKLRIKQLVKKFFKTYSFSRVKSVVDHPDFAKEFCCVTDAVINIDDKRFLIVQYQRPDGKQEKRYLLFTSSNFWNDSKEEPIKYQSIKFPDIGLPAFLKYQFHHEQPQYCIVGPKSVFFHPKGGLLGEEKDHYVNKYELTDRAVRHQNRLSIKETIYNEYKETDFRFPSSPQLGNHWMLYLLEETRMLVGINSRSQNDVTLHVLVAEGVQCFDFDGDHLIVMMTTTRRAPLANRMFLGRLKDQPNSEVRLIMESKLSIATAKIDFASDISTNNEFTCIKHKSDFNLCMMANADSETGQNHLMVSRPGHNSTSGLYKILEIQSLQITARTTPVKHIHLITPDYRYAFMLVAESSQLHVCYFLYGKQIFGVLQFNHPVGSEEADVYGFQMLSKEDFIVYGYDVLETYRVSVKMNLDF